MAASRTGDYIMSTIDNRVDSFLKKVEAKRNKRRGITPPSDNFRYGCVCGVIVTDSSAVACPYCKRKVEKQEAG